MRRAVLATAILLMIFLVEPITQFEAVEANPYTFLRFTRIDIHSPQYHVYVSPNVDVSFDYYAETNLPQVNSFSYTLDSNANSTLASSKSSVPYINFTEYSVTKTLQNLSNDNHKLIVYAYFSNTTVKAIMDTIIVVDTTFIQPIPNMISPLNQTTYNTNQVPLNYSLSSKIIYSSYTLDTSDYAPKWVGFTGNTTLTNLTEGSHKIRLHLESQPHPFTQYEDNYQTIFFSVDSNQAIPILTPDPSSIVPEFPAILALTFLLMATLAVVVVFRRKKQ